MHLPQRPSASGRPAQTTGLCAAATSGRDPASVHDLLARVALHYRQALAGAPAAAAYLRARGVGYPVAQRYEVGYAGPAWRGLGALLAGCPAELVRASGLVVSSREQRMAGFDRFRDRLMFPIRAPGGQVVGFGGRRLGEADAACDRAKYLNSPEGPVFHKGALLYGLHEASQAIVRRGCSVVMEGYLDVLLSVQAGLEVAVGSLGTAVSAEQVALLLPLAPRVVFCFDGDAAGRRAAARALQVVAPLAGPGAMFGFALLPAPHDPASLVQAEGAAGLARVIDAALPFGDFAVACAAQGCDLTIAEGRARAAALLGRTWGVMRPGAARDGLVVACAALLGVSERLVEQLWRRVDGRG